MYAVIFQLLPSAVRQSEYLQIAAALRPELERIDGFLLNERYRADDGTGGMLSLSLWRDEKSLVRWRTQELHYRSQGRGRAGVLADYRLRVGEVISDSDGGTPTHQLARADLSEVDDAKHVTISIATGGAAAALAPTQASALHEVVLYTSLNDPEVRLVLASWTDATSAQQGLASVQSRAPGRHIAVNIIRSYGLRDRREASMFHPQAP